MYHKRLGSERNMQYVGKKEMCCIIIEGCEHVQIIIFDSFLVMRAICYLNNSKKATILHRKKFIHKKYLKNLRTPIYISPISSQIIGNSC